jgi:hypothetical protein
MSGLFLNFFQLELSSSQITINTLAYRLYNSKEAFVSLKEKYPKTVFFRDGETIFLWSRSNITDEIKDLIPINITLNENPQIFSKIIENSFIDFLKKKLVDYKIYKNKYSHVWEIVSPKNILQGGIDGLTVNRIIEFSPYFFHVEGTLFLGFTLSKSLKNIFNWNKKEFEQNGIDITGLKFKDDKIYANRQSIKRFLDARGVADIYEQIRSKENKNDEKLRIINIFFEWITKHKDKMYFPFDLRIKTIQKNYLPYFGSVVYPQQMPKPERVFYSNKKNTQALRRYDEMVKAYRPYSLEVYRVLNVGIICPSEYQGETEVYINHLITKIKEVFHFSAINPIIKCIGGTNLTNYKEVLYDKELLTASIIYIIINDSHKALMPCESPYFVCKAKFIGNGIPTQDIRIETIRSKNQYAMTNIALNSYAKIGGTAWTIEKEGKIKEELIVGIGSTFSRDNKFVLGIAQIFQNDGKYLAGNCSPLSTFENYEKNLENHLYKILKPIIDSLDKENTFRLIFHLFKSGSEEYEIKAINNLKDRFNDYNFEFALIHLSYGHNFRLYNNDGKEAISQGLYIELNKHSALLHFVNNSDLPLKIDIDKRSTFTSLFYLSKQVYWFSHLSHRSYIPSKRTVTIMYPSLMAQMTEKLKEVDGWDYDRLTVISEKLWFI